MLNDDTVKRYISDNSGSGTYLLKDTGSGIIIHTWDMGALAEPTTAQLDTITTTLSDEDVGAFEEEWREEEFIKYDARVARNRRQVRRSETETDSITTLDNWGDELADMTALSGYPNTHTRPVEPA